jgi:hypothetical protein
MPKIRKHHFADLVRLRHLLRVLTGADDEFKSPELVLCLTESAAYGRSGGVAQEAESRWEEKVIHVF